MVGHAMTLNCLDFIRLDHLTGLVLYSDLAAIKVSQHEIDASKSLEKRDLLFNQKISSAALESIVGLLLDLNDDITGLDIREFISLAMEDVFLTVGSALIDLDLEYLLILDDFLAIAFLALVFLVDDLTLTVAVIAWASTLRVHARSQHLHDSPHTATLAGTARSNCSSLASETIALGANAIAVNGNFGRFAIIDVC